MATGFLCEIKRQDIGLTAYAVHVPGKFSDHGYPIQPKQVLFGSSLFGPSHDNFRSQVGFARELLSAELIEGTENALAFVIIIAERSFLFYQAINVGSKCSMKCMTSQQILLAYFDAIQAERTHCQLFTTDTHIGLH